MAYATVRRTHPTGTRSAWGRYLSAAILVRLADEGARVALVLLALQRTGSAGTGGALVAALLIPHVVSAPVVGWLADRAPQPRWVLTASAAGFALSLVAAALLLGRLPVVGVLGVLFLGGCCGPALTGGLTSQLSGLVEDRSLPRAYGADSLTYNVAGITGPAVAAVVAGAASPSISTLVLGGSAAAGALVLATLPTPRTGDGRARSDRSPLLAGVRAMVRDRTLAVVTAASSLGQLGPGALAVVAAVLAARRHHPASAGWLMTALAVGGLIGSLLWTWRPATPRRSPVVVMLAMVGVGVPLVAAAGAGSLTVTGLLFGVSGVFLGPFTGALFSARERHSPVGAQSQVFTIGAGLKTAAAAAGAAVGGALAPLPSAVQLLFVGGSPVVAGGLGVVALGLVARRRTKRNRRNARGGRMSR